MSDIPTRHVERLLQAELAGTLPDLVLFFGHQRRHGERIGVECLSQWYPAPFVVDGVRYPTAEHWMMAHKARLFDDLDVERQILADPSPAKAKKLGRQVRGFDSATWAAHSFDVVAAGSLHKFRAHRLLRQFLLATGDAVLVEASPYDQLWGIGLGKAEPRARTPSTWNGTNWLGFALMEARAALAPHEPSPTEPVDADSNA